MASCPAPQPPALPHCCPSALGLGQLYQLPAAHGFACGCTGHCPSLRILSHSWSLWQVSAGTHVTSRLCFCPGAGGRALTCLDRDKQDPSIPLRCCRMCCPWAHGAGRTEWCRAHCDANHLHGPWPRVCSLPSMLCCASKLSVSLHVLLGCLLPQLFFLTEAAWPRALKPLLLPEALYRARVGDRAGC